MGVKRNHRMLKSRLKKMRNRLSRTKWAGKLLNVPCEPVSDSLPGVVMIQIDGLSFRQFEKALRHHRLPFIKKLLNRKGYQMQPMYAGVPSTTPGVQAELFFGKKTAVPAFEFYNRKSKERHVMFRPQSAAYVADHLKNGAVPLLRGGSSYGNIYTGGASEARYCVESMKLASLIKSLHPARFFLLMILYFSKVLRIAAYALLESALGISDFFRGMLARQDILKEMKFLPTRVFICIILRELIRLRVKMDVEKGVRIIHANLVGYDEQAHRRGPDSEFALWTLKGIDNVINDIYRAASKSNCRRYTLLIYSDHGQEPVTSYEKEFGRPVEAVIRQILAGQTVCRPLSEPSPNDSSPKVYVKPGTRWRRIHWPWFPADPEQIQVTTTGPIGHIYLPEAAEKTDLKTMAEKIVRVAHVPNVLYLNQGQVWVADAGGTFQLDSKPERFLGDTHPFTSHVCEDLKRLLHHFLAGDLVISGWRPDARSVSFSVENGAHGGPGANETQGVVLMPGGKEQGKETFRPMDLRNMVMKRLKPSDIRSAPAPKKPERFSFRVLSYNIHSCINILGKMDPFRTAEVMAQYSPDVVALQEVDANRRRSGFMNQAKLLAQYLDLTYEFLPLLKDGDEAYGLAILSRYPYEIIKSDRLDIRNPNKKGEPRGAIWIKIMTPAGPVDFVNTHLGLTTRERMLQIKALLGKDWCRNFAQDDPMIVCGDLNAGPRSPVYREIDACLSDVQKAAGQAGYPKATFMSMYPIFRIDHMFISRHLEPVCVHVPTTLQARIASDHLPLLAELRFREIGNK